MAVKATHLPRDERGGIQVIDRAVSIMEVIGGSDGLALTAIARRTGMATSTVHRILGALETNGLVFHDEARRLWFIGVKSFEIGSGFARNRKPIEAGRDIMRELMETTGESVNMALIDQGEVVYVAQIECHSAIRAFHRPGSRGPVHSSGVGKALLAWRSRRETGQILQRHGMRPFTNNTITGDERFFAELGAARERGYAIDDEERYEGMRCAAAAIFNEFGEAIMGVSISGPSVRLSHDRLGELGPAVRRAADEITTRIGGRVPDGRKT